MIITYYVIASSETDALDQVASQNPPPIYCGTSKGVAHDYLKTLTPDGLKSLDLYTVTMVSEKCQP